MYLKSPVTVGFIQIQHLQMWEISQIHEAALNMRTKINLHLLKSAFEHSQTFDVSQ